MQVGNSFLEVNQSEVAVLMRRLDEECAAAHQALYGFAHVGKHEYITRKMENVGKVHDALIECVGEERANELLVRAMDGQTVQ